MKKRRNYGRYAFVLVLATWWTIGLFGLDGARRPSVPLVSGVVVALLTYKVVSSAHRRRRGRDKVRYLPANPAAIPQSCVIIRLGEPGPSPF